MFPYPPLRIRLFSCNLRQLPTYLLLSFFVTSGLQGASDATSQVSSVNTAHVMEVAGRKLVAFDALSKGKGAYPNDAKGAIWTTVNPENWVSGFYPGALWYLYAYAKGKSSPDAERWKTLAEAWTDGLRNQQFNTKHHDIGFIIFGSYGNGYLLTGNPSYLPVINQAAESLTKRFVPATGLIRSWGKINDQTKQMTIIDSMMNLELLMWASSHRGKAAGGTSEDLVKIAKTHANRVNELWFRPDGSLYHVVDLDPLTGKVLKKHTQQGKSDESAWSRGQAWAIYGFGSMYQYTKDPKFLEASKRAANYYIQHLPADFVPPSDFNSALNGLEFKDSSAAAIAASALIQLSQQVTEPALKSKYFVVAEKTLVSLTHPPYFAEGDDKAGILAYASRNYSDDPANILTNTSLICGDYYLLEALLAYDKVKAAENAKFSDRL